MMVEEAIVDRSSARVRDSRTHSDLSCPQVNLPYQRGGNVHIAISYNQDQLSVAEPVFLLQVMSDPVTKKVCKSSEALGMRFSNSQ